MIPQRNLSLLSNRLFRDQGGRRIPEAVLQRDYCLAWFLATLATHPLREHLAFKGGTALRRCHFANYRFSEDLDFTLLQAMEFPAIQTSLEEIFASLRAASRIEFRFDHVSTTYMKTVTPSIWHIRARCPRRTRPQPSRHSRCKSSEPV